MNMIDDIMTTFNNFSFNERLIDENYIMANDQIPEMLNSCNLILLNGKLSGKNVNIMVDTGAQMCVINKSLISKCNIDYMVDKKNQINVQGANSTAPTFGTLWYVEIELETSDNNFRDGFY
jgi:maltodextrin utilization protein YvdJ